MLKIGKNILHRKAGLVILILLFASKFVLGQQDPMYTQYMFNTQTFNPAYAGTWNSIGFMALSRMQWVGIDGAPSTQTFSFQMPLQNRNVGIGLNVINDKIGIEKRFSMFADYSYKINFGGKTNLRMGIKGGFSNYSNNLTDYVLYPDGKDDPSFRGDIKHRFLPNVGVGFLLENPDYYVGLSMPKVVNSKYENSSDDFVVSGEIQSFFLDAGYVVNMADGIRFKPTMLLKATFGAPLQLDLSANVLLKDKFWLGAMYRTGDSFGFVAQWIIDHNLRLGYAIDFSTSNLRKYHYSSHEVMVSYELQIIKKQITSPRFF
ncbi:MAG TPA: type IX secretion system membrane protein PorP/SprF [Prolixibacteraceae bacterium]|nr:type IX secretion system membrane protein PorP/SprF [Prolixibacteraceae bacterium]HPS13434.1 type IX secretion system membrane protein PorP/SprF [Prolixibacteraceae bacterium]